MINQRPAALRPLPIAMELVLGRPEFLDLLLAVNPGCAGWVRDCVALRQGGPGAIPPVSVGGFTEIRCLVWGVASAAATVAMFSRKEFYEWAS